MPAPRCIIGRGAWVLGVGGELRHEPSVAGKSTAPHATPGVAVDDPYAGEVVERFLEGRPGQENFFPKPEPRAMCNRMP